MKNILLLVSDQHRRDWMGCAGCEFVETPNLDGLAARGIRFENAYCNAPLCGPSRMSMLTGRHPYRNGIYINEDCLDSNTPTFAQALADGGYETVLCGRMHFMGLDQRHGFQRRLVGDICRTHPYGRGIDFGELAGTASNLRVAVTRAGPGDSPVLRYDEDVTRAGERFLTERTSSGEGRPLFLTVGWYGPHHPFIAPPSLFERASAAMRGRDRPVPPDRSPLHPWVQRLRKAQNTEDAGAEQVAAVRANYAAMIDRLDQHVGRILTAARNLPGETTVIYVSDHGEMAGDRRVFGKGCFYEASAGVPFIVAPLHAGAGRGRPSGAKVDAPVSLLDVAPTLVRMGGARPMPWQDGNDLTPLLDAPESARDGRWADRPIFSELKVGANPAMRMVRRGCHKLCYYHECGSVTLHNVADDPLEQHDLAGDPGQAPLRDALLRLVLEPWDPAWVTGDATRRMDDYIFGGGWGRADSKAWQEVWNPAHPVYEFRRVGEALSFLQGAKQ